MVETGSLRVLDILANAAALIAEGEVLQLTVARDLAITEETYIRVVRGKTAALFSAATEVGAVIADASHAEVAALQSYGDALGIAFQIADDLLDVGGTDDAIGKRTGDDIREGKMTMPVIIALARASDEERAFWRRVIGKGDVREGDVEAARDILVRTGALEETRQRALEWSDAAADALDLVPQGPMTESLRDLAGFVVSRIA